MRFFVEIMLLLLVCLLPARQSHAFCVGCPADDLTQAQTNHTESHTELQRNIIQEFDDDMEAFSAPLTGSWLVKDFLYGELAHAMAKMTTLMNVLAMQQAQIIGAFLDAKNQMETQRLFQQLQAEAYKDYQPSEDFCVFGTTVRSLAASESKGRSNTLALSGRTLERQLGNTRASAAWGVGQDMGARWRQFTKLYCDPKDNNWLPEAGLLTGLHLACNHAADFDISRVNRDIDYTRLIGTPPTLEINFTDGSLLKDEEDILALSNNLYGHRTLVGILTRENLGNANAQKLYMDVRGIVAKRSVAESSFNAIVGMKSSGSGDGAYMKEVIKELLPEDAPDEDIEAVMGENPSYYAQLEFLAKKIYHNPTFYSDLYDKPANVARKNVAMKAIEIMVERALFESQLRREMIISVLLSSKLRPYYRDTREQFTTNAAPQK